MAHLADSPQHQALFHYSVQHDCGWCPSGCRGGRGDFQFPTGRVYRSSRRSLTMQCTKCGVQWMVTVHRVAQVVAQKAKTEGRFLPELIAELWAEWASAIDDQRGRRKASVTPN
jgi:hypothetical protein